ncbi:DUF6003 family protein [Streptomyces cupreus]|uniref:Helix-turn-helix domain-containing protein n=1 Tax=Streptomyces cupreus TaxID=2759956 RepID=A0A7X1JAP7_9ACTN|nr:DUF6003 family protein [Streptomyces cupreus]MBC2906784.1 hypothetical protein [Streptomyces cupreus]
MPELIAVDNELLGMCAPATIEQASESRTRNSNRASPPAPVESKTQDGATDCEAELVAYRRCMQTRDDLIRKAKAAGLTEVRIAQLTGHSRNTVRAALGHKSK